MDMSKNEFASIMALKEWRVGGTPFGNASMDDYGNYGVPRSVRRRERLAELSIFVGLCLMFAVLFVATSISDARQAWSDGLLTLLIAQSAILTGTALKFYWTLEGNRKSLLRFVRSTGHLQTGTKVDDLPQTSARTSVPENIGELAGRQYIAFPDGSVEIDTLLGRRRFSSIDAAREFVGE